MGTALTKPAAKHRGITPGNPGNSGGRAGRSGRRPYAITEKAAKIVEKGKLLDVAKRIVIGDIREKIAEDKEGSPIYGDTKNSDRLAALRLLLEYGFGKAPQKLDITAPGGVINITEIVINAHNGDSPRGGNGGPEAGIYVGEPGRDVTGDVPPGADQSLE